MINHNSLLVCIEGIDGAGKSTQTKLVAEKLTKLGYRVVTTFEPGDTSVGKDIKAILKNHQSLDKVTETLLMVADRRQHISEVIEPKLKEGFIVITDRYYLSTFAYQVFQSQPGTQSIESLDILVTTTTVPYNLAIYLKIDLESAITRLNTRKTTPNGGLEHFEKKDFLNKVLEAYDRIFNIESIKEKSFTIDANQDIPKITDSITAKIIEKLVENNK